MKKARLTNVHPHDLRRTCGSWLTQMGVPLKTVAELLRHSDISVTSEVYAHMAPASIREALTLLDRYPVSRSGFTLQNATD